MICIFKAKYIHFRVVFIVFTFKSPTFMATVKIIISFNKLRDDDLDTKSQVILNSMAGNVNFTTPIPALADVIAARTAYVNALTATKTGNKQQTALKNETRKTLEEQLRLLALYVQATCKNNEVIALSSGFDIQKSSKSVGVLAKPTNFKVQDGPAVGSCLLSSDKITGAKTYTFEYTPTPITAASTWVSRHGTAKNIVIDELESGKQYAFRMAGVSTDPTLVYSDVLMRYVQ
jgi:hypothetical protein